MWYGFADGFLLSAKTPDCIRGYPLWGGQVAQAQWGKPTGAAGD
ncbi:hypothetical protein [Gimesia maris]